MGKQGSVQNGGLAVLYMRPYLIPIVTVKPSCTSVLLINDCVVNFKK